MGLQGIWWNEIGCKLEIEMETSDPKTFRGVYHSKCGSAFEKNYPLLGRCDNRGFAGKMLAFVVVWMLSLLRFPMQSIRPSSPGADGFKWLMVRT